MIIHWELIIYGVIILDHYKSRSIMMIWCDEQEAGAVINILVVVVSALLEAAKKTNFKGCFNEIATGFSAERYIFIFILFLLVKHANFEPIETQERICWSENGIFVSEIIIWPYGIRALYKENCGAMLLFQIGRYLNHFWIKNSPSLQ